MNLEKKIRDWSFALIILILTVSLSLLLISYVEFFYLKEKYFVTRFLSAQYGAGLLLATILSALIVLNIIANLNIFSKIKVAEYEKTEIVSSNKKRFKLIGLALAVLPLLYLAILGCLTVYKYYSKWQNYHDVVSEIKATIDELELQQDITDKIAQDIYHSKQKRYQELHNILRHIEERTQTGATILAFEGDGYATTYYNIEVVHTGGCDYIGCYDPAEAYSLLGGLDPDFFQPINYYTPFKGEINIFENMRSEKVKEHLFVRERRYNDKSFMHYYRFFKTKYGDFILKLVIRLPD